MYFIAKIFRKVRNTLKLARSVRCHTWQHFSRFFAISVIIFATRIKKLIAHCSLLTAQSLWSFVSSLLSGEASAYLFLISLICFSKITFGKRGLINNNLSNLSAISFGIINFSSKNLFITYNIPDTITPLFSA